MKTKIKHKIMLFIALILFICAGVIEILFKELRLLEVILVFIGAILAFIVLGNKNNYSL